MRKIKTRERSLYNTSLYNTSVNILSKTATILSITVAVSIAVLLVSGCNPQTTARPLDSGDAAQVIEKTEPSPEAFKTDCLAYAKDAFGVEPGKDGVNEDSILLTVAPALAGYWSVDIIETPSDEQYEAFMTAFEASPHWDHSWDEIETELTYEQSAQVVKRLMDFCYETAVKNGWTPGTLPEHADLQKALESIRSEETPEPGTENGEPETVTESSAENNAGEK